jgi:V8-like Glu-specific endopeptidase
MSQLINSSNWIKHKSIKVRSLHLDTENYRIAGEDGIRPSSEKEIIAELVRIAGIEDLAKKITIQGYFPVEDVIVVIEDGKKVVVEGNRRLCACRLLQTPSLAPKDKQGVFKRLAAKMVDNPVDAIPVVIAPNRAEANIYIYSKHTDAGFSRSWSRIQQSVFIVKKLEDGYTKEEISDEIGISEGKIDEARLALELFRLAGAVELPADVRRKVTDPKDFPYTPVVERIFKAVEVQKATGITVNQDTGRLTIPYSQDDFKRAYAEILKRTQSKGDDKFDSRTLSDNKTTISKIKPLFADAGKSKTWSSEDIGGADTTVKTKSGSAAKKKAGSNSKSKEETLIPSDFDTSDADSKLQTLLEELKKLKVRQHLQSSGILLRAVLELSLMQGIRARNKEADVRAMAQSGHLKISDMLNAVKDNVVDLKLENDEKSIVRDLVGKQSPYNLARLNDFVHGQHFPADYPSIITLRTKMLPIIRKAIKIEK